jgi:hypothetical protein
LMTDYITVDGKVFRTDTQSASFVTITPTEALAMMVRNTRNRNIRRDHIDNITRDMAQGNWMVDGSAIRFDTNGRMIDGQHRLRACIISGKPLKTLIVTGIDPKAGVIIDTGAKRTAGDMLNMIGNAGGSGNTVAAAIRVLVGYATGELSKAKVTMSEVYSVFEVHPGVARSATAVASCPIERSMVAALHYAMSADGHTDAADNWARTWNEGVPAYSGDPAHRLRERFLRERTASVKSIIPVRRNLALNAYRHFIAGIPIKILREHDNTRLAGWSLTRLGLPERASDGEAQ